MNLIARLFVIVLAALLSGCVSETDSEQARICRAVLPVLHPGGTVIDVSAVGALDPLEGSPLVGVRIDYLAKPPGRRHGAHYALCYFDPVGFSASERVLRAVITDRGHVSEAALIFISRYYLNDPETAAEAPGPGTAELARLPHLPEFLGPFLQHSLALLPMTGVYALLAASYALVYGLIGRINLAFGGFAAIGGVAGALALFGLQAIRRLEIGSAVPPALALLFAAVIALTLAACWGEALAALVLGPLMRRDLADHTVGERSQRAHTGQPILIATAGLLIALPEFLALVQQPRWLTPVLSTPSVVAVANTLQITVTPFSLIVFVSSISVALLLLLLMKRSRFGRAWRACADDPLTASLFGVSQMRVLGLTVTLACGLAGFAGFIFCVQYGNMGYSDGRLLGMKALVAAVAGGIGSLPGAMLGGLTLGILEALWSANLPIESRDIAIFCALVALLVLRPGGLFGFGDLAPRRV